MIGIFKGAVFEMQFNFFSVPFILIRISYFLADMIKIFKGAVFEMQFLFFPSLSFLFVYPIFADMIGIFRGAVFEMQFPVLNHPAVLFLLLQAVFVAVSAICAVKPVFLMQSLSKLLLLG